MISLLHQQRKQRRGAEGGEETQERYTPAHSHYIKTLATLNWQLLSQILSLNISGIKKALNWA